MDDRRRMGFAKPPEKKGNTLWIIMGTVVVIVLGVFLYTIFYPAAATSVTKRGPYSLIAPNKVGNAIFSSSDNKTMMINDMDEALQFFVYLDGNLRMGQAQPPGASPDTGMFQPCKCNSSTDCGNCVPHVGYQTLVNIQNTFVLEILNSPDASRPNSVAAQIYVKTQFYDKATRENNFKIETFPLPPLPEQKWTMVTISKQGRQINVYYNSTLVLAKKAQNNFSTQTPTCSPVSVGSNTLSGNVAMVTYFTTHQNISNVSSRYQQQTDTRGNLNTMNVVPTTNSYTIVDSVQSSFIKTLCLDLSCFRTGPTGQALPNIPPIYNSLETQYR